MDNTPIVYVIEDRNMRERERECVRDRGRDRES
jgi:hypothetical protein